MEIIGPGLFLLLLVLVVFLVGRQVALWYWRIAELVDLQRAQLGLLREISAKLGVAPERVPDVGSTRRPEGLPSVPRQGDPTKWTKRCPGCGGYIPSDADACRKCGGT